MVAIFKFSVKVESDIPKRCKAAADAIEAAHMSGPLAEMYLNEWPRIYLAFAQQRFRTAAHNPGGIWKALKAETIRRRKRYKGARASESTDTSIHIVSGALHRDKYGS
jgi:hypothetical protein